MNQISKTLPQTQNDRDERRDDCEEKKRVKFILLCRDVQLQPGLRNGFDGEFDDAHVGREGNGDLCVDGISSPELTKSEKL